MAIGVASTFSNACQTVPTKTPSESTPAGLIMKPAQLLANCMMAVPKTLSRIPIKMCDDFRSLMMTKPIPVGRMYRRTKNYRVSVRISGPKPPKANTNPKAMIANPNPLNIHRMVGEKGLSLFNQPQP